MVTLSVHFFFSEKNFHPTNPSLLIPVSKYYSPYFYYHIITPSTCLIRRLTNCFVFKLCLPSLYSHLKHTHTKKSLKLIGSFLKIILSLFFFWIHFHVQQVRARRKPDAAINQWRVAIAFPRAQNVGAGVVGTRNLYIIYVAERGQIKTRGRHGPQT